MAGKDELVKEGPGARIARQMIGRANAERPDRERAHVAGLSKPEPVVEVDAATEGKLARADMLELQADRSKRGRARLRRQAAAVRREVGRRMEARVEAAALADRMAETDALDQLRGGEGLDRPASGPAMLRSHDGLASLSRAGTITANQAKAGLVYRAQFEAAHAGLKSGLGAVDQIRSGVADGHASALQRALAMAEVGRLERRVVALGDRELHVLRAVAGEGHTIRALGGGGKARQANTDALVRALEAVLTDLVGSILVSFMRD